MRRRRPQLLAIWVSVFVAGSATAARGEDTPLPLPPPATLEAPPPEAPPAAVLEAPPPALPTPVLVAPPPTEVVEVSPPVVPAAPPRPRFSVAIGPGVTFEHAGLSRTAAVPAFFATGGVGTDWPVGVELAAFASSATGRFKAPDAPVDRLALAAVGVGRPFAWSYAADDARYGARVLRSVGGELGLGLERDGQSLRAGTRFGVQLGARVELPLTRAGGSELRIRFAARRLQGLYTPTVATTVVGNGFELYTALATIF